MNKLLSLVILTLFSLLISCSTPEEISTEESARLAFENAKGYQDAGRYELALDKFNYVKNKFPLTKYAIEAELEVANTYFLKGEYKGAIAAYESFKELHPENKNLGLVTYKIGESYFSDAPTSIDRDLTPLNKGIRVYEDLINQYPRSQYIKEAKGQIKIGKAKLAEKEIYISDYYTRKGDYKAAVVRLQKVLDLYKDSSNSAQAAYKMGDAYLKLGKADDARKAFQIASADGGDPVWSSKAISRLEELNE